MTELHLAQDPESDRVLSDNPLALVIGMVLDQQVPLEWAFAGPAELQRRLGTPLDAPSIAAMDPQALVSAFAGKPALHRYPASMAARVQELCKLVTDRYGGRPEGIWEGASSAPELLKRIKELPGFGDHKAKIFVALLGKQLGVRPDGWEQVSAPFSEPGSFRSVADITDTDSLARVRSFKQSLKADAAPAPDAAPEPESSKSSKSAKAKAARSEPAGGTRTAAREQ